MNELERRLRGKVRQSRSEKFQYINEAVNLTTEVISNHFEQRSFFLSRVQVDSFKVLILSTLKDSSLALLNAQHMLDIYPQQIISIEVICPAKLILSNLDPRITSLHENDFLGNDVVNKSFSAFGERSNWIKQQYLKMYTVANSDLPVLILDADTFLNRPIFLFGNEEHTLLINTKDFHYPYTSHARKFLGRPQPLLNFVNHLQIQFPEIYQQLFSKSFDEDWLEWAELGRIYGEDSPISEFQTYAGALINQEKFKPIIVSLDHENVDVGSMSFDEFKATFKRISGDLFTVGNKMNLIY
jgi:hypothetical protein